MRDGKALIAIRRSEVRILAQLNHFLTLPKMFANLEAVTPVNKVFHGFLFSSQIKRLFISLRKKGKSDLERNWKLIQNIIYNVLCEIDENSC